VGGSNNHYKFSTKEISDLTSKIKNTIISNPGYAYLVLTSRRTSKETINSLKNNLKNLAIIWNESKKNPYIFALKYSEFFIVTSDSTSMISECAFTGKSIFIFHLPYKRKSKRIEKFHQLFKELKIAKNLKDKNILIPWTYKSLNESQRIASILKEKIIKENS